MLRAVILLALSLALPAAAQDACLEVATGVKEVQGLYEAVGKAPCSEASDPADCEEEALTDAKARLQKRLSSRALSGAVKSFVCRKDGFVYAGVTWSAATRDAAIRLEKSLK